MFITFVKLNVYNNIYFYGHNLSMIIVLLYTLFFICQGIAWIGIQTLNNC